jgi:hypothetical protein
MFSLEIKSFFPIIYLSISLILSLFFYILVCSFLEDIKIIFAIAFLSSLLSFLFLPLGNEAGIVFIASFVIFMSAFIFHQKKMKSYLTFSASKIIIPSISRTIFFFLVIVGVIFYIKFSADLTKNGFKVPDSLIDLSLSFVPSAQSDQTEVTGLPIITSEQIALLKQNPDYLRQYGLDPKILDTINISKETTSIDQKTILRPLIQAQIDQMIKPNTGIVAIAVSLLYFFSLQFLTSLLILIFYPLTEGLFWLLEKLGLITYQVEMREVKKLVV